MFHLHHGESLSLFPLNTCCVSVTQGRLWITTDQSREDFFVNAGEQMTFPSKTHIVLEAWNKDVTSDAVFAWSEN
jgi:Protein of unknown function (DUF2917)